MQIQEPVFTTGTVVILVTAAVSLAGVLWGMRRHGRSTIASFVLHQKQTRESFERMERDHTAALERIEKSHAESWKRFADEIVEMKTELVGTSSKVGQIHAVIAGYTGRDGLIDTVNRHEREIQNLYRIIGKERREEA